MTIKLLSITAGALALAGSTAAFAEAPQILSRDARGHATEVRVDGQDYAVCNAQKKDECINPRQAGLKWGNRALANWSGKPTSNPSS